MTFPIGKIQRDEEHGFPVIAFYDPTTNTIKMATTADPLPMGDGKVIGKNGGIIINDTDAHTGLDCYAIKAFGGDVVISSITLSADWTGSLDGLTISDGDILLVAFTALTLTSGKVILYKN
jgi:hypothetical protein